MIPVVLGILIALFIDNCKDDFEDRRFKESILSSIQEELRENVRSINDIKPTQDSLLKIVEENIQNDSLSILDLINRANGFKSPSIKHSSWDAVVNSKLELFEYKTISQMTDIEEGKQNLDSKLNKMMDFVYQNLNAKQKEEKLVLKILIFDVMDSENSLLQSCNSLLKQEIK